MGKAKPMAEISTGAASSHDPVCLDKTEKKEKKEKKENKEKKMAQVRTKNQQTIDAIDRMRTNLTKRSKCHSRMVIRS
jgi:hypothetical protein